MAETQAGLTVFGFQVKVSNSCGFLTRADDCKLVRSTCWKVSARSRVYLMNRYDKLQNEDIKKKHHYLPVTYTKQWSDKDGKLLIQDKNKIKTYKSLPENIFFERNLNRLSLFKDKQKLFLQNLYQDFFQSNSKDFQQMKDFIERLYNTSKLIENCTEGELSSFLPLEDRDKKELDKIKQVFIQNLIEDQLSNVESHYGEFIELLLYNNPFYKENFHFLIEFLAIQKFRSKSFLDEKNSFIKKLDKSLEEDDVKNIVIVSSFIESELLVDKFRKNYLILQLIENTSEEYFISSDSPVVSSQEILLIQHRLLENILECYMLPLSLKHIIIVRLKERTSDTGDADFSYMKYSNIDFIKKINNLISLNSGDKLILPPR